MTKQHRATCPAPSPSAEGGFTLIEALVAMVILIFGLMAVSNLFLVATSSTSVANQGTAAAVAASEVLEALRATAWPNLVPGGDSDGNGLPDTDDGPTLATCDNPAGSYNCNADTPGVGRVHVRWVIRQAPLGSVRTLFVQVQAEGTGALSGARSRATFSMFRTCTDAPVSTGGTCPDPPIGGGF